MVRKPKNLREKAYYDRKIKRAVSLLFYKRHRVPGIKGWEIKQKLGSDYPQIIEMLNDYLDKLNLTVKTVLPKNIEENEKLSLKELDKARFYVTLKKNFKSEDKLVGWRIDDLAALAVSIGYIISKEGKVSKKELEKILKIKLANWRVEINLNRFIKSGYFAEDEKGQIYWCLVEV